MMHFVVNCEPIFMLCAVSAESRALMQPVLASEADNAEVSSRVQALLAGSNLTTRGGLAPADQRHIEAVNYDGGEDIPKNVKTK